MTTLLFGGAGFIGQVLTRWLRDRDESVVVGDVAGADAGVPAEVPLVEADVTDYERVAAVVEAHDPDRVVNLAYLLGAPTERRPTQAVAVNCLGADNVLRAAAERGVDRIVYASSIAVYGLPEYDAPLTEDVTPPAAFCQFPSLLYSATKQLNEYQARRYADAFDVSVAAPRPSLVFGAGRPPESPHAHWSAFVEAPARGETAHVPHRPDQRLSLVPRTDVADLFGRLVLADDLAHHAYNTGGHTVTVRDLAAVVDEEFPGSLTWDENADPVPLVEDVSNARAREELGYELTPLREALRGLARRAV